MARIAVLGSNGFVGSHTVRCLRAQGVQTRAVVRRRDSLLPDDHECRIADACDVYALRHAFAGCETVVHAALGPNEVIVGSIAPVYAAAQAVGVKRVVYISSGSVHGQSPAPGTDERSRLHTHHAFTYNTAKVRAERKLRRLRRRGTVEIVILRPTIVFGPGSRWVFDFGDALRRGTACVVDGARGICNSIYVDNLGYAVLLASRAEHVDGEVFLVGDRETVTWRDLYRPIAEALGYDIDAVPSVSPPQRRPSFKDTYLAGVRSSEAARWVSSRVPAHAKEMVKGSVRMLRGRSPATASTRAVAQEVASAPAPSVPDEIAELQRCRWRLPNDKAVRMLAYDPPVSFAAGCQRSVDWLLRRYGCAT
jgi:nucleoside-diphosphate-sugar epimerase